MSSNLEDLKIVTPLPDNRLLMTHLMTDEYGRWCYITCIWDEKKRAYTYESKEYHDQAAAIALHSNIVFLESSRDLI